MSAMDALRVGRVARRWQLLPALSQDLSGRAGMVLARTDQL